MSIRRLRTNHCEISLAEDTISGVEDLLGRLQTVCTDDGGYYYEIPIGKRMLQPSIAERAIADDGNCPDGSSVKKTLYSLTINLAFGDCFELSGQFNNPTANCSRYLQYIQGQGTKISGADSCHIDCAISTVHHAGSSLQDVLGALRQACVNDGGVYESGLLP